MRRQTILTSIETWVLHVPPISYSLTFIVHGWVFTFQRKVYKKTYVFLEYRRIKWRNKVHFVKNKTEILQHVFNCSKFPRYLNIYNTFTREFSYVRYSVPLFATRHKIWWRGQLMKLMKSSVFWVVRRRWIIVGCQQDFPKRQHPSTFQGCVTDRTTEDFIHIVAQYWNHAWLIKISN
jgi:hypothetical protein